jgi:hypothetical protein
MHTEHAADLVLKLNRSRVPGDRDRSADDQLLLQSNLNL